MATMDEKQKPGSAKPDLAKPDSRFAIRVAPAVAGVIAGVTAPATAQGGVILSNLADPVLTDAGIVLGMPVAQAFLTGPQPVLVFEIIIDLLGIKGNEAPPESLSLYSDLSGNPGTDIADGTPNGLLSGGELDFQFTSPVTLDANTMYWVLSSAGCDGAHCVHWGTTGSSTDTSDFGVTFQGDLKTFDGTSWGNATPLSPAVGLTDIEGETAAPEPGGLSLVALGGVLLAWIARRRKRSPSD